MTKREKEGEKKVAEANEAGGNRREVFGRWQSSTETDEIGHARERGGWGGFQEGRRGGQSDAPVTH